MTSSVVIFTLGTVWQQTFKKMWLFWPWLSSLLRKLCELYRSELSEKTKEIRCKPFMESRSAFCEKNSNILQNINQAETQGRLYLWSAVLCLSSLVSQSILETIPDVPAHSNGSADPGQSVQNAVSGEWHKLLLSSGCVFLLLCWHSIQWAVNFWKQNVSVFSPLFDSVTRASPPITSKQPICHTRRN